ncbi:MAG TPA: hypothetical protein VMY59_10020 [Candidatus Thermoplasmatota archaeon]|nr:hypothetical protein [Candidatus Thermoplasmatota archaeon]
MKSDEIKAKQSELEKQLYELERQREQALITERKGYFCKKCEAFIEVEKISAGPSEEKLCGKCYCRVVIRKQTDEVLVKLLSGKIVNVEFADDGHIKMITVLRNGVQYDLKPRFDPDSMWNTFIIITYEYKADRKVIQEAEPVEIPPWKKKRLEKPIITSEEKR